MKEYLKKILQAKVYEVAKKTPLDKANNLSKNLCNQIYLKNIFPIYQMEKKKFLSLLGR